MPNSVRSTSAYAMVSTRPRCGLFRVESAILQDGAGGPAADLTRDHLGQPPVARRVRMKAARLRAQRRQVDVQSVDVRVLRTDLVPGERVQGIDVLHGPGAM